MSDDVKANVDIESNGVYVARDRPHTQVTDVTRFVRDGCNTFEIVANGPSDRSGQVSWSITLGEGHVAKGRAVIAVPHVEYTFAPGTRGHGFSRAYTFHRSRAK